jgi:hypothetical protein
MITMFKPRRMRLACHIARMVEQRNTYVVGRKASEKETTRKTNM